MTLRRLIREGRDRTPVTRVASARQMPPRPPGGRQPPSGDIWGVGAATIVSPDPAFDPCGAPPVVTGKSRRRT